MPGFCETTVRLFAVRKMRSATVDCVLLTLAALVLNVLIARDDIGFFRLSPSPYLLIPVLVGCRHGLRPGLASGILVSLIRLAALTRYGEQSDWNVEENLWETVAPALVGFICGGAVTTLLSRMTILRHQGERLRRANLMMGSEIRMLRHDMDETLRLDIISRVRRIRLEDDLRALMTTDLARLPDAMMAVLRNHAQVREAALYRVTPGDPVLRRMKLLGDDRRLPETLDTNGRPMLSQAVELARLTSAPVDAKAGVITDAPHLIAAPILYGSRTTHLLVVTDVPLIAFSARTIRLVAIVCKCMEECLAMWRDDDRMFRLVPGGLNRRIYTEKSFLRHLATFRRLALEEGAEWRLCVVAASGNIPGAKRLLEETVMPALDPEDITHSPEDARAALFVLLPWTNANAAKRLEKRLRAELARNAPALDARVETFVNPREANVAALLHRA